MHFFQTLLIFGSLLLWSVFEVRKVLGLHINTEASEEIKIRVERTEEKKHVLANEDSQQSIQEWH